VFVCLCVCVLGVCFLPAQAQLSHPPPTHHLFLSLPPLLLSFISHPSHLFSSHNPPSACWCLLLGVCNVRGVCVCVSVCGVPVCVRVGGQDPHSSGARDAGMHEAVEAPAEGRKKRTKTPTTLHHGMNG
jgi:hypothetical protein